MKRYNHITSLNQWLILNSNGNWEREFGFKITSMSDPGWKIQIDTIDTCLEGIEVHFESEIEGELHYYKFSTENNMINIIAGVYGIDKAMAHFSDEIMSHSSNKNFLYDLYMPLYHENVHVGWFPVKAMVVDLFSLQIVDSMDVSKDDLKLASYEIIDIKMFFDKHFHKTDIKGFIGKIVGYRLQYSLGELFIVLDE